MSLKGDDGLFWGKESDQLSVVKRLLWHLDFYAEFFVLFLQLVEKSKLQSETNLMERKEKVLMELHKLKQRVEEFNHCGELDMIGQYVLDVRSVQKRITECLVDIQWVNKEEGLFNMPPTEFPEVEEISIALDPFQRLFSVVQKWQKAEKKWGHLTKHQS